MNGYWIRLANVEDSVTSFMTAIAAILLLAATTGCSSQAPTGKACLGDDADSLVEGLGDRCSAGDTVATKHPAYFCNFNYSVAYNDYNSAICVYNGSKRETREK